MVYMWSVWGAKCAGCVVGKRHLYSSSSSKQANIAGDPTAVELLLPELLLPFVLSLSKMCCVVLIQRQVHSSKRLSMRTHSFVVLLPTVSLTCFCSPSRAPSLS
jgi:hypothetical protein